MEQVTEEAQRKFAKLTQFLYNEMVALPEAPPRTLPATPSRVRAFASGIQSNGQPFVVAVAE